MSSIENTKKIKSIFILEILGRPPEHLKEVLGNLIKKIEGEKGVELLQSKIHEPVLAKEQEKIEESKRMHTTFAEVEIEVEEISLLVGLMFKYMPANVEVIEPETIYLSNNYWTEILSEITRRLHGYDEVARVLQLQNSQMKKKLEEMFAKERDK